MAATLHNTSCSECWKNRRPKWLLLAGPVDAGETKITLEKCSKSSNGHNSRHQALGIRTPGISYERDFMTSLSDVKQAEIIEAFKSTSRCLDDLLNIDNPYFEGMINRIYPPELQLNKAITSDTEAPFLAHLSRRLTGELIGYVGLRRLSVVCLSVRRPHSLNIFSSETAWPIIFHMEPSWDGGTKVCSSGPGHMTKMAAMPISSKNFKKSSSPKPKGRWPWNVVCSIGCSSTTKFVQMMTLGWPWSILRQSKLWSLMLLYGKKVNQ